MSRSDDVDALPEVLSAEDVDRIEQALGVSVPRDYRSALLGARPTHVDQTSLLDSPDPIIELTIDYRNGFAGLPKWPREYVYIGDEADACPYVIRCDTGEILKLDKGNADRKPLRAFPSLSAFFAHFLARDDDGWATMPNWRKNLYYYAPLAIGMTVVFVVLPLIAIGVKAIFVGL